MKNVLVIPDAHAHPKKHNKRFEWLAGLIDEVRPDVIVCIGDFWDMPSLARFDKGKGLGEGLRYEKDIEAGLDAMDKLIRPSRRYKPRKVFALGNHEERIYRAANEDPALIGKLSYRDLDLEKYGWEVMPFLEEFDIEGVSYAHYFTSGVMGRPIGGTHKGRALLQKGYKSATQGHDHLLSWALETRFDNVKVAGLSCGCFFDYYMEWAGPANKLWWRGVVLKRNCEYGQYDFVPIRLDTLRKEYAGKRSS